MVTVRINKRSLKQDIEGPVAKELRRVAIPIIKREIESSNRELIRKFLAHEISREIAAGPNASNISGTLSGDGNLFSFLGFEKGSDPVGDIANLLNNSIKIKSQRVDNKTLTLSVSIQYPTKADLDKFAELPWVSRSWLSAIERGISGLGRYLHSDSGFSTSRSSTGLQAQKRVSARNFKAKKYISSILNEVSKEMVANIKNSL